MINVRLIMLMLVFLIYGFAWNPQSKVITEKFFPNPDLTINTPAFKKEKGFTKYQELIVFLNELQKEHSNLMAISYIGESQKGKKIPMVTLGNNTTGSKLKIWMQGGLHGNEPASTEGLLHLINTILGNPDYEVLLDRIELVIVPMANIDGYEIQNRYAANGLDLNRDQTKLNAKESVFLKKAFSDYDAEIAVDFHEYRPYRRDFVHFGKFGITSRFDVMFLYSGNLNVPQELREYTENGFVKMARESLLQKNYTSHEYITTADVHGDIQFNQGSVNARSSATSYALTNCISSLIEVRGVGIGKTSFTRRVMCTYEVAMSYLQTAYNNVAKVKDVIGNANAARNEVVVKSKRAVSAEKLQVIDLDKNEEVAIDVIIRDALKSTPILSRKRPVGYAIESSEKSVIAKLRLLGLDIEILENEQMYNIENFKVESYQRDAYKYEGVYRQEVTTSLEQQKKVLTAGTAIVWLDQKNANLAFEVIEPEASNSFISFAVIETSLGAVLPYYRIINKQ